MKQDIKYILDKYADVAQAIEKKALVGTPIPLLLPFFPMFIGPALAAWYIGPKAYNYIVYSGKSYINVIDVIINKLVDTQKSIEDPLSKPEFSSVISKLRTERQRLNLEGMKFENVPESVIKSNHYKLIQAKKSVVLIEQILDQIGSIKNAPNLNTEIAQAKEKSKEFVSKVDDFVFKLKAALDEAKTKATEKEKTRENEELKTENEEFMKSV